MNYIFVTEKIINSVIHALKRDVIIEQFSMLTICQYLFFTRKMEIMLLKYLK